MKDENCVTPEMREQKELWGENGAFGIEILEGIRQKKSWLEKFQKVEKCKIWKSDKSNTFKSLYGYTVCWFSSRWFIWMTLARHEDFYMNMLEARNSAMTTSSAELFDRRSSLLEIISARMPFQCEKFFENYEQGNGFQKLLDFVLKRINLLKIIQT